MPYLLSRNSGSYAASLYDTSCTLCPAGTYASNYGTAVSCTVCPAGSYCPTGAPLNIPCPTGTSLRPVLQYVTSLLGFLGSFSAGGASACSLCQSVVAGVSATVPVPYYFWTSPVGAVESQCVCQNGYTGTNCEFSICSTALPGGSLGSLLFQADSKLRQYAANASAYAAIDVMAYLYNLLHVGFDVNGDGNITTTEMFTALSNRLIYSSGMASLPLWCRSASTDAYCYEDFSGVVEVKSMYDDAFSNFNSTGNFDGSGRP